MVSALRSMRASAFAVRVTATGRRAPRACRSTSGAAPISMRSGGHCRFLSLVMAARKSRRISSSRLCRRSLTTISPPTITSFTQAAPPENTQESTASSPLRPMSAGWSGSSTTMSQRFPGLDGAHRLAERWAPPPAHRVEQPPPGGAMRPAGQHVAGPVGQALGIFELAQVLGGLTVTWLSDPMAMAPPASRNCAAGKDPVAEIGFGRRAQPTRRRRCGPEPWFRRRHVRGVDRAPARRHIEAVEQIFDRTAAAPGDAVLDFLGLLGHMNVDRRVRPQPRRSPRAAVLGDGPQRMGRDAEPPCRPCPLAQPGSPRCRESCRPSLMKRRWAIARRLAAESRRHRASAAWSWRCRPAPRQRGSAATSRPVHHRACRPAGGGDTGTRRSP
jgi:hypothetical protein